MVSEAEKTVYIIDKIDDSCDLFLDLFRQHENMRVILSESPHSHQTVKGAGQFMSVHLAQFSHPDRKIPVGVHLPLVSQHGTRTIHRFDGIISPVELCKIHIFLVMIPMSGSVPQIFVEDQRRLDLLIASLHVFLSPEGFQFISDHHSLRHEKRKAGTLFIDSKEVHLLADLPVIFFASSSIARYSSRSFCFGNAVA